VLPSRAVPPRRRGSCREQRRDDSRHKRSREAPAGPALRGAQRDPIRARRHRERLGKGHRGGAHCPLRRRRSFVRPFRRDKPLGPRGRRAQRSTEHGGRRRRARLSDGTHRPLHLRDRRVSPPRRRRASPWSRRRVSRFRNRAASDGGAIATGAGGGGSAGSVRGTGSGAGGSPGGGGWASGGKKRSGSRYPSGSAASRTPRCTYGTGCSDTPLGPTAPTASPSATAARARLTLSRDAAA
jgi:hypothetical protein